MRTRICYAFVLTCLLTASLDAASDPFCGKWKLSKMLGQQAQIEDLGNQLKIDSGPGSSALTIPADGTDHSSGNGNTMSINREGPNVLKIVFKKDGKVMSTRIHTLSKDGKTKTIKTTDVRPDGTNFDAEILDKRVGSGSGWSGLWVRTDFKTDSLEEYDINPYGAHGLTFYIPKDKDTLSMNFDGQEYPQTGPNEEIGSTASGRRPSAHMLEITDKVKGKVVDHYKVEVSSDGRTLTLTIHRTDDPNTQIMIYEKM